MRFLICLIAVTLSAFAMAAPEYRAHVRFRDSDLALETPLEVRLDLAEAQGCLYVPAQDPNLLRLGQLETLQNRGAQDNALRQEGRLEWMSGSAALNEIAPGLYRIPEGAASPLRLAYQFFIPGWKDRPEGPRFLRFWYPILLDRCPEPGEAGFAMPRSKSHFQLQFDIPDTWKILAQGQNEASANSYVYEGRAFSAVLYKAGEVSTYESGHARLLALSTSKDFKTLAAFVAKGGAYFERYTGSPSEKDVLLVETPDFEPSRSPGLLTLNTPQQPAMRFLQQDMTNWNIWQMSMLLAQQWFGMECRSDSVDSLWFVQGMSDMLTFLLLQGEKDYYELFSRDSQGRPWLEINYRQAQDAGASSLSLLYPHNGLVDANGKALPATVDRPYHNYLRHGLVLRYLRWRMGNEAFKGLIQDTMAQCRNQGMGPERFLVVLARHTDDPDMLKTVKTYWQSHEWPDLGLGRIETDEATGKAVAVVHYANELQIPIDLWVTREDGQQRLVFVEPKGPITRVILDEKPDEVKRLELNPGRAVFDSNRFNNRTGLPNFSLFPGNARGLADDAYTILWIPFVAQLPGEPFTFQLGWQVLRYLDTGVAGLINYQPETNKTGFKLLYLKGLPKYSLYMIAKIAQDDKKSREGERVSEITLQRRPLWMPRLTGSTRFRMRQELGNPDAHHLTHSLRLFWKSEGAKACGFDIDAEMEKSVWVPSEEFSYTRTFGNIRAGCESKHGGGGVRLFWGAAETEGPVPAGSLFRAQNLEEAHVRLDRPSLDTASRIEAINVDSSWPARLPLPESWFILPRRSQFRLFWDGAQLHGPDRNVVAAGVGYSLPLGGDIAGNDAVTFLRFSLNSVLYRRVDKEVDTIPGILFDFSGEL